MMRHWISGLICSSALAVGAAHGATMSSVKFDLKRGESKVAVAQPQDLDLRAVFEGEDWAPSLPDDPRRDFAVPGPTAATSRALAVTALRGAPIELGLQPLAGHISFDTMQRRRATLGWSLTNSNNLLGVGTTGTYGIRLAKGWRMTSFVSLDYNRIDTARYVDLTSPNAFINDNADTGMTGTMGATLSHRFGAENRFRALAYGAMVAATSTGAPPREFGTVGARLVNAIGDSALKALWEETGLGLDYRLTTRAKLNGAVIQTLNRLDGDTLAAKFGIRVTL